MYNAQFAQMMTEILGDFQFATTPRYEVGVFNRETGEQKWFHEFDCQDAADAYARRITQHAELTARLTSTDSQIIYLYDDCEVSSYFAEVQA